MSLLTLFTQTELDMILQAIRSKEAHARAIAKRNTQGYGTAAELQKKEDWAAKADEWLELENKIANNID